MKKRILSILLLCCMVLTLLPTAAFAAGEIDEQFTLAPGGTYYFDLSAMGIPGTVNDALPDKTMRYVPFTYAGTVDSYKLTSEMATTEEYAETYKYAHSLFIADFAVTHEVSWDELNAGRLIFGKDCAAGGVEYMLRAPSVGSDSTGSGESQRGTPQSNEWDRILDKNGGYIKNWSRMHSWGQDISRSSWTTRAFRGYISARYWTASWSESSRPSVGFRPVLEILNPGTLVSDGLKAVTLDLGGGKLGNSFKDIQIIVKKGSEFTAPASDGLTRPDGNADSYFQWLGSDGKLYAPGDSVPADVTKLTAQFNLPEQFTLTPGGTYYFDLSGVSIPGTANGSLPDASLHYVPFTYAGTVDAYKLMSEMATTEEDAEQNQYPHSLFVADYAVTHTISWDDLNTADLIFGKNYAAGGVSYTLRAPSAGSGSTGSGESQRGTPQSNEWDKILDKDGGYIKNWNEIYSWGQDTNRGSEVNRAIRGYNSARSWSSGYAMYSSPDLGFRPVLEVLNPGTLGSDWLKVVTLDLGGGKLGSNSDHIQIIVKKGESFTAPASNGLTRPDGNTGSYFKWLGSDGKLYVPGGSVPANVNKLTAQFDYTEQFTLDPGGTYYFDLSGVNIPGTVNDALPDKTMHYVPFTYAGTVDAYKLASEMVTTEEYAAQNKFAHSLFMADYAVTHTVSWNDLNTADLIFGKDCAAGGVEYMLRAPSVGSGGTGWDDLEPATPQSNEWDKTLDKYDGYIKNWSWMHSWGQDTESIFASTRAIRGLDSARGWDYDDATYSYPSLGFRPVLEVLNPGTLGSDGLKAVTLDLGGGKLGNSSEDIQIIVKNGKSFTAPASEGLTRPDGNTGNYFKWRGSDGELYAPDDNVPADVTKLTAQFDEQFTLAPGGTYYFDLSGESIPGTADDALPDKTMHYVPFTYAGTVDAYKLTSAMAATDEYAEKNKYAHSLFVADYTVTHTVSWDELNAGRLIFGRDYAAGGVDYILRAPSVGSGSIGSAESQRGTPPSNEWDRILDKNDGYIKNWFGMFSWGQDTLSTSESDRAARGYFPPGRWSSAPASHQDAVAGFRPVLEILSPGSLGSDGLKAVTLDLGGGKLGNSSEDIQIIVKSGESFAAPASDGLTRPDGNTDNYFKWLGSDGELYEPGDNVSADATKLTAQFASSSHSVTITTATLPDGKVGEAYSQTLTADGTTPITWSVSGALPDGLTLVGDTIKGTPSKAGDFKFTVKATNSAGSDTKELSITITKDAPPAHEHRYGDWRKDGTNHWHECTDADCPNREESIKDKAAHVYTDDADTTCDTCGYERTVTPPSHEHSYGDWRKDGTSHWHECTDDDCPDREESIKDKAAHVYTDDADTTCDTCGYERTITPPAHEHRYGDWRKDGTNHWHECTDADCPNREESIKDKAAHVYDNDADTTCNTCGYERTVTPPAHEHIVTFDGNGGTPSVGSMTTTDQKLPSLPSASRSGSYSFDGWYTKKNGGTNVTTATVFSANTTVYAHWTYTGGGGGGYNPPVTYYTLRFETGGGSDIPSVQGTYNTYIDLTKYVPTWRGHTFIGWYSERSLMNKVSGVYLTKDMTVYAGWRVDENPGTGANPFTDVSEKDWFYGDVMFVYENGLMLGTSKTLFSPHGTATCGMMATTLWRMEGSPVPKGKNSFTDVEAGKWYADAITWTAENGIFAGYGKDKFGPDDPITREQLAAIFYRYADYKGYDLTVKGNLDKFKDADKITDYAKTAMQWAVGSSLVKGKSGNLLDPQGTATRAEIAAMLHRFIEKYELVQGKAPGGLMGWIDPKRLQIPKTGDSSVLGLWGISLCTSLAGCLALTTWQIRRRREEESLQIIEK